MDKIIKNPANLPNVRNIRNIKNTKNIKNLLISSVVTLTAIIISVFASSFGATNAWFAGTLELGANKQITVDVSAPSASITVIADEFDADKMPGIATFSLASDVDMIFRVVFTPEWVPDGVISSALPPDVMPKVELISYSDAGEELSGSPEWEIKTYEDTTFFVYTGNADSEKLEGSDCAVIPASYIDDETKGEPVNLTVSYKITDVPHVYYDEYAWTFRVVLSAEALEADTDAYFKAGWNNCDDVTEDLEDLEDLEYSEYSEYFEHADGSNVDDIDDIDDIENIDNIDDVNTEEKIEDSEPSDSASGDAEVID